MTDKELKRLKRRDLLKMLLDTERENRYLSGQLESCREELERYKKIIDGERPFLRCVDALERLLREHGIETGMAAGGQTAVPSGRNDSPDKPEPDEDEAGSSRSSEDIFEKRPELWFSAQNWENEDG